AARRSLCFFFQAEDGIRDRNVTGVQTCALPILPWRTWPACVVASVEPRVPTSKRRLLVIVFPSWGRGLSQVLVGRAVHGPRGGYSIFLRFLLLPLPTARVRTFHRADLLGHAGRQVKQRSQGIW